MFEHFTFGAQAQTECQDYSQPSPTDTSSPLTPTFSPEPSHLYLPPGMSDLVSKLDSQHLRSLDRDTYFHSLPSPRPPFEVDDDMSYPELSTSSAPSTPRLPSKQTLGCRRLQRQLNVQLQSCTRHVRDINNLVEQMIASNSQCIPRTCISRPSSRDSDLFIEVDQSYTHEEEEEVMEDEGFVDGDNSSDDGFTLRRASAPSGVRKYGCVQWRSSADSGSRGKVWQQPRMRKRPRSRSTR